MPELTLAQVDAIAADAHAGQFDKIGVPYIEHPRAVAAGLAPFGVGMQMAGLLHDVLEDTPVTAADLRNAGVPESVISTVERVTKKPRWDYEAMVEHAAEQYASCLLKIADNSHNSHPDRTAQLPPDKRERLATKYQEARSILWPAVPREDVAAILRLVNPSLLGELENLR
jgi:(p)ppGpp synthase/HD superfamily hydrolase